LQVGLLQNGLPSKETSSRIFNIVLNRKPEVDFRQSGSWSRKVLFPLCHIAGLCWPMRELSGAATLSLLLKEALLA